MIKKVVGIFVCMLLIATFLFISSSIRKNEQNNLTEPNKICNFNIEYQDLQKSYFPDFPVMDDPMSFLEPDEISPKPIPKATPSQFSWMNNNGKDWTTPGKNQGNCGSCWAFAALGTFESIIEIKENCADLNPDLSEQYVLSCLPCSGSCSGGRLDRAFYWIMSNESCGNNCNGVIPESCFEYYADDEIPCSDKCQNWEEMLIPLLDYGCWTSDGSNDDIQRIKTQIMEKGPVATNLKATKNFMMWGAMIHHPSAYFFHLLPVSSSNHVVIIVGRKDSSKIFNGGYWICKNSWGPEWGYNGFFNVAYGCLNIDRNYMYWVDYDPDSFDWPPYADTGGPYGGYPNQEVTFDANGSMGFEGNIIDYSWDFGDEKNGSGKTTKHIYQNLGKYIITLTIKDSEGNSATKTTNLWIQETNNRPVKPTINGPSNGNVWKKYEYNFTSTDPDENDLLYYIDWGDGRKEEWIGPYASGEEIVITHIWTNNINSEIKVKVKDPYGDESDWAYLEVTMPKTYKLIFNFNLLSWFFERFPNAFPILRYILGL